jgi:hypothetical protein
MKRFLLFISIAAFLFSLLSKAQAQVLSSSPASGGIFVCAGSASAAPNIERFTVSGTGLTAALIATAPAGFEVSLAANGGYGNSVTIASQPATGTINSTIIYVRASASAPTGNVTGNVVLTSSGTKSKSVAVSATVNPIPYANKVQSNHYQRTACKSN